MNLTFLRNEKIARAAFLFMSVGMIHAPLWAQQAPEKAQVPETKREIRWGKTDESGLRLGIFQVEKDSAIFCVLENAGENPIIFNDYYLGYFEAVSIQVRLKGTENWVKLPSQPLWKLYNSAGPSQVNRITLAPHQHHRGHYYYRVLNAPPVVTLPYVRKITPERLKELRASSETLKRRESERSSFWIYAQEYAWPTEWKGTIEFKVQQEFPNFGFPDQWKGELESGILEVDAANMVAERARYQSIYTQKQKEQEAKREQDKSKSP